MTIFKKSSADGEMGNRLATIDMGRKVGELMCPFLGGSFVPIQHNVAWAEAYLSTKWYLDPFSRLATIHQYYRQLRQA